MKSSIFHTIVPTDLQYVNTLILWNLICLALQGLSLKPTNQHFQNVAPLNRRFRGMSEGMLWENFDSNIFAVAVWRQLGQKRAYIYKTVTRSTDSSRMTYFFFIIALTAVLAMAVQGNQGRHFLWNNGMLTTRLEKTARSPTLSKALASLESLTAVPGARWDYATRLSPYFWFSESLAV
jgi:hypothetical protein